MFWSATNLKFGFARGIVGYDFRAAPPYAPSRKKIQYCGSWFNARKPRLSADQFVWPRFWEPVNEYDFAPWGLANSPDLLNEGINHSKCWERYASLLVAFDMPISWIEWRLGSLVDAIEPSTLEPEFHFRGFDIVHPWFIDGSALYSFDRDISDVLEIMQKVNFRLNSVGLIDDVEGALRASCYFTTEIAEHAPFAPCGVWTKPMMNEKNS